MGVHDIPIVTATVIDDSSMAPSQHQVDIGVLQEQGFPLGLAETLIKTKEEFPLRIWVVDNSASMKIADGHKILETSNSEDVKPVSCTRWSELLQTVEYHAQLAHFLHAPTIFRLLNDPGKRVGPQQFSIAENQMTDVDEELEIALQTIRKVIPQGTTPLTEHIHVIREIVRSQEPDLKRDGNQVVIIIATDGTPTNKEGRSDEFTKKEFTDALRTLEQMPVKIIFRLCTDEKDVVKFYNKLDNTLELTMEVLDDFSHEASEIYVNNPWLNYALTLHRCREMGYRSDTLDTLDKKALERDDLRKFLFILFGSEIYDEVPSPMTDWAGFVNRVSTIVNREKQQWNPVTKRLGPWVDIKKLEKEFDGKRGCAVM
jgi:hypothetical protein